jgi:hypothetical protein
VFSEDGVLYRARVLALQGSRARLLFIDFGNCEEVEVASLVELPPGLRAVPGLASRLRVAGASQAGINI